MTRGGSTVAPHDTIFPGANQEAGEPMGRTNMNFFSGAEILIAEDSQTQAEQLRYHLSSRGYAVTVTRNGKQALASAVQSTPAMIITDVVMPEMDGYTLCKEIKSSPTLKDVPVVLLTSLSGPQDIVRGLECGADSFLRKPYDDTYLVSRVEYILTNVELRKSERLQVGVRLQFGGQTHFITAEKQQILDLLISTYEGAVRINEELEIKQQELLEAKDTLEARVAERTTELAGANERLQTELAERKRAEDQVKELNQDLERRVAERTAQLGIANKDLEAFSYSVSHDLRAPLRRVNGFAHILVQNHSVELTPDAQQHLKHIQEGTQKMGRMIEDLLNLARLDRRSMAFETTPLRPLVDSVVQDLKSETAERDIEWRIGSLSAVTCDPGLLRQVFANLLSNAVKYTRPRGRAVIEVGESRIEGQTVIFVRDNGAGFDPKYADKLFGVFQRLHTDREFEGTGIGLATVERIIRKHGGRVWAEAETNKGATFHFSLGALTTVSGADHRQAASTSSV
jgi:two-component system sensor histidine kinase/response regulator